MLPPEVRESGRGSVFGGADAELFANALAQLLVDGGDTGFAIEFDEGVALGHVFEFAFDHGLIADERPVEIVGERHVAAGFPVADGLGFFELACEGGFGADIKPEGEMRAECHGVEAGEVIAIDAANHAAGNEREDETVGEDDGAGAEGGNDAVLELIEEIGGIHEREGEAGDGVFGEEFVNVAADEIGAAEAAGLNGEAFGLEPFLQQRDLGGAAGAVHAFDDDEGAVEFGGVEADEGFAEETLRGVRLGGVFHGRFGRTGWRSGDGFFFFLLFFFFWVGHDYSASGARGAKRLRSILEATMSRICFWSLLTGSVPSRTTRLSESTILSYSSRMRAWKSLKLSGRS